MWESAKWVLFHIDQLNVTHLITTRHIYIYHRLHASNTVCNVAVSFLSRGCDNEYMSRSFCTEVTNS